MIPTVYIIRFAIYLNYISVYIQLVAFPMKFPLYSIKLELIRIIYYALPPPLYIHLTNIILCCTQNQQQRAHCNVYFIVNSSDARWHTERNVKWYVKIILCVGHSGAWFFHMNFHHEMNMWKKFFSVNVYVSSIVCLRWSNGV